jgi:hypothetical protein
VKNAEIKTASNLRQTVEQKIFGKKIVMKLF